MDQIDLIGIPDMKRVLVWADQQEKYIESRVYEKDEAVIEGYKRALKHLRFATQERLELKNA